MEGRGGEEIAAAGDLLSEVNELGGRGDRGVAAAAGLRVGGGGVLYSPPIA